MSLRRSLVFVFAVALAIASAYPGKDLKAETASKAPWAFADYCKLGDSEQGTSSGAWRLRERQIDDSTSALVAEIRTGAHGKGRVVQSISFSQRHCALFATSSLGGKPEVVALWQFRQSGLGLLLGKSTEWGHGQDLSLSVDGRQEYMWLPNSDGTGVVQLKWDESNKSISELTNIVFNFGTKGFIFHQCFQRCQLHCYFGQEGRDADRKYRISVYKRMARDRDSRQQTAFNPPMI